MKKKQQQKNSENDQSTGHFLSFFFLSPDPKSEKNSRKSTNKKNLALTLNCLYLFQIQYETFPARTWHNHQEEEDCPRDRPQDCPPVIFARRRLHQSPALLHI